MNDKRFIRPFISLTTFAVLGSSILLISHAATPSISVEPETNANAGLVISDSSASGGAYIKFLQSYIAPSKPFGLLWANSIFGSYSTYIDGVSGGPTYKDIVWCDIQPDPAQGLPSLEEIASGARSNPFPNYKTGQQLGYKIRLRLRAGQRGTDGTGCAGGSGAFALPASKFPTAPDSLADYVNEFIGPLVRYYSNPPPGSGMQPITEYAIENEVDAGNWWAESRGGASLEISATKYYQLAEAASQKIHEVNPRATVYDGGLASPSYHYNLARTIIEPDYTKSLPTTVTSANSSKIIEAMNTYNLLHARRFGTERGFQCKAFTSAQVFLDYINSKENKEFWYFKKTLQLAQNHLIDRYQLHYYDSYQGLDQVLSLIRSRTNNMPIDTWEYGFSWPPNIRSSCLSSGVVLQPYDPQKHAEELVKLESIMLNGGASSGTYLTVKFNQEDTYGVGNELYRGLFDLNNVIRPAGQAFETIQKYVSIDNALMSKINTMGVIGTAFNKDNKTNFILYSTGNNVVLHPSSPVEVYNITGETRVTTSSVTVTTSPIYVLTNLDLSHAEANLFR